jgi:hypothetical protein
MNGPQMGGGGGGGAVNPRGGGQIFPKKIKVQKFQKIWKFEN